MKAFQSLFNDGAAYERLMGRWSKLVGQEFLDWMAPAKGLSWLDVGCGNGAFTEEIIARCAPSKVAAVDPSEGQLGYARTRAGAKLAEFRVADAQSLPFDDRSFDAVAMALVISFVPDPAKAAAEMTRVARPGSTVATYMWDFSVGGAPVEPIYRALRAIGIEPPRPANHAVATPAALQKLWTEAGLQAVEARHFHINAVFASVDDYWESNSAPSGPQGVLISRMPPDQRARMHEAVRAQLTPGADGRVSVPAIAAAVKGKVPQ
jgi:ubiquinone/menaquinone biosynthesis C-methylase UbiE